ncbi:hypothetical protein SLEP1_g2926 [Rubroshorea leprosula]|uniref:Uncharacterized protein n=1 Tax=Rubroshorea leprosula TaxID=152421 RepID=A0AAV5HR24_9ROSI|nr:hypothetical protein SLEP1_g2926 [Rubroshorea leprosula]
MSSAHPSATATSTATATPLQPPAQHPPPRSLAPLPTHHLPYSYPPHSLPLRPPSQSKNQQISTKPDQSPHSILYPVASSGRGFIPKPLRPDQTVTVANPNVYSTRPLVAFSRPPAPPIGSPHLDALHSVHFVRPSYPQLQQLPHVGGVVPGAIKGISIPPHSKVGPSPSSIPENNGNNKNLRDRNRDESLITLRDRKVKITNGTSLYALCRSWLRNGFPDESQPQYGDIAKSLPQPLPMPVTDELPERREDEEQEEEEEEESVEHLSAHDLLKRHIKRAKKVRARLREERLKRIARYKTRLALLLPPLVEQFRNDAASGN